MVWLHPKGIRDTLVKRWLHQQRNLTRHPTNKNAKPVPDIYCWQTAPETESSSFKVTGKTRAAPTSSKKFDGERVVLEDNSFFSVVMHRIISPGTQQLLVCRIEQNHGKQWIHQMILSFLPLFLPLDFRARTSHTSEVGWNKQPGQKGHVGRGQCCH